MAVTAAVALHMACLAATVFFVRIVTLPAAAPAEQAVQIAFVPSAVATPAEAEAAVVAEPEAMASPEPAAAAPLSEAGPPEPETVAAVDHPDEPAWTEPVAAPPAVPTRTVEAPAEQAAKAPEVSAAVPPEPPPALPPAQPQPHLPALRPMTPPRVASSRDGMPVHAPQQSHAAIAAAAPEAVGREAAQAHDADQEASLEAHIRDAVQAAVRYPVAARMMDITGRARVQLDYRNGAVADPLLAQSSGTPMLDQAALRAAQSAHYPATPPMLAGRLMRFLVWVEFRTG